MFWILTVIAVLSVIYCVDAPLLCEKMTFLINDHDSILYGVGLSIVAAYIFYIFQIAIPEWRNNRKNRPLINEKLKSINKKMESIRKILGDEKKSDETKLKTNLEKTDLFSEGAKEFYSNKEVTKIEALNRALNDIHIKILEIFLYKSADNKVLHLLGKIDEAELHKIIMELYENQPGQIQTITPPNAMASGGLRLINKAEYDEKIIKGLKEYKNLHSEIKNLIKKMDIKNISELNK
jgi:hypothetical protein